MGRYSSAAVARSSPTRRGACRAAGARRRLRPGRADRRAGRARLGPRSVRRRPVGSRSSRRRGARYPGVDVRRASAEELPFADDAFDAALAQLVVHFMTDPVAGLREMARVTRPGGVVAACVWDHAGERRARCGVLGCRARARPGRPRRVGPRRRARGPPRELLPGRRPARRREASLSVDASSTRPSRSGGSRSRSASGRPAPTSPGVDPERQESRRITQCVPAERAFPGHGACLDGARSSVAGPARSILRHLASAQQPGVGATHHPDPSGATRIASVRSAHPPSPDSHSRSPPTAPRCRAPGPSAAGAQRSVRCWRATFAPVPPSARRPPAAGHP